MSMDGVDDKTVFEKQEELANRGRAKRFTALLREQDIASRADTPERTEEAARAAAEFEREAVALNALVDAEIETLVPPRAPYFDMPPMVIRERMHVFGPDSYSLGWSHLDSGQAGVDVANGSLHASNYTTGPARFTVAQLGVKLRTTVPACKLSVRAYVQFTGYDILNHRVFHSGLGEQRRAWALGSVGVKVDSWNLDGSGYHLDGENWVNVWDRSLVSPLSSQDYAGSLSSSDGLIVEPLGFDSRDYAIWVTCRVGVSADPGFSVSTYATSSIGCHVPYFVVEEIDHW